MNAGDPSAFPVAGFASPIIPLLDRGERLIWSGQPRQGVRLQAADVFMIPFSLMWGGFALFWEASVLGMIHLSNGRGQHQPPIFMAVFGLPFVFVGIYIIFGRFFADAASRRNTWYAITDRRLIILQGLFSRRINSYDYATLSNLNLVERGDQSGDILFGSPNPMANFGGAGWPGRASYRTPGFYLLPGARAVFSQIQAAQPRSRGPSM